MCGVFRKELFDIPPWKSVRLFRGGRDAFSINGLEHIGCLDVKDAFLGLVNGGPRSLQDGDKAIGELEGGGNGWQ